VLPSNLAKVRDIVACGAKKTWGATPSGTRALDGTGGRKPSMPNRACQLREHQSCRLLDWRPGACVGKFVSGAAASKPRPRVSVRPLAVGPRVPPARRGL